MKNKKAYSVLIAAVLAATTLFAGCSSKSSDNAESSGLAMNQIRPMDNYQGFTGAEENIAQDNTTAEPPADGGTGSYDVSPEVSERKIIVNVNFNIETKDFTKSIKVLDDAVAVTNSLIASSESGGDEKDGDAYTNVTLKVPADQLDEFKKFTKDIGNITHTTENTEDVTGEYFDTEARLTVLKAQEARVLQFFQKAVDIEEMMQIENELSRIRIQIERYTTVIKQIDGLTDYSTVSIRISQTRDYTVKSESFLDKVGDVFKDSFESFTDVLAGIGSAIVWLLPYLAIAVIIFFIIRSALKKKKSKNKPAQLPVDDQINKE